MQYCAVIGNPIKHSLSPLIHNKGYEKLGLAFQYEKLKIKQPKQAIQLMKEKPYRGFSVTLPYKQQIMQYLDEIDPTAQTIGAINTIVNEHNNLVGYNTDMTGSTRALKQVTSLKGLQAAIIGAGGAARAIAFGLIQEVEHLIIQNRTLSHAKKLAADLKSSYSYINEKELQNYDLIINTTPVGMYPNVEASIISEFPSKAIVMDIVYNPLQTKFLQKAKQCGCTIITGLDMFLYQAIEQFELFTGETAPVLFMKQHLTEELT